MKILIVNGSPNKEGAVGALASYMQSVAKDEGVCADIFWLTNEPILSCIGCGRCRKEGKCFKNDIAARLADTVGNYDGYIFASPTHYAGISGQMKSALTRLFFMASAKMRYKPAGAICVARRAGATLASEEITRYFTFNSMPVSPANYFCVLYAKSKECLRKDSEGLQTARALIKNLIWLMRLKENGERNSIYPPESEEKIKVGFLEN